MILDPVATFFIYVGGIAAVLTLCAFIADEWTAKVERDARHRARAEARAQRGKEKAASGSRSSQPWGSSS